MQSCCTLRYATGYTVPPVVWVAGGSNEGSFGFSAEATELTLEAIPDEVAWVDLEEEALPFGARSRWVTKKKN